MDNQLDAHDIIKEGDRLNAEMTPAPWQGGALPWNIETATDDPIAQVEAVNRNWSVDKEGIIHFRNHWPALVAAYRAMTDDRNERIEYLETTDAMLDGIVPCKDADGKQLWLQDRLTMLMGRYSQVIRDGKAYVTALRQAHYAGDSEVVDAAKQRLDQLGSRWFAALRSIGEDD